MRGLSPRVRGNPLPGWFRWQTTRSIPACAGQPGWAWTGGYVSPVYPRVCGATFLTTVQG